MTNSDSGNDPFRVPPEELLAVEHSVQHTGASVSAEDGTELQSHTVEVWGETSEGGQVSLVRLGRVTQPNGIAVHPMRVHDFCPKCKSFSEWLLPVCPSCAGGICKSCASREVEKPWHRDCLKRSRRRGLFWGLLGLPLRFFIEKEIEEEVT